MRLDPEDLREVIVAYQTYVTETVVRFDGFVASYMGDGVLVYFGYPQAHEHASERAARAGLELVRGLYERDWPSNIAPQIRIGIATGLVVVGNFAGEDATQQHGIVGETPNLAARLQALAQPNTVVIAPTTRRLTGGLFDYRDLGALALKGFADTVRAWQVMGLSAAESRFEALREAGVAPLLGRDEELELLLRQWQQAKNGEGRVVLLSGESGIGKSRLGTAPKALHRWPAMSVPGLPQAGLCRRSEGFRWPQPAQGCKGSGEAWSCARICVSSAATICPVSRQARWTWRRTQKIRSPRPANR